MSHRWGKGAKFDKILNRIFHVQSASWAHIERIGLCTEGVFVLTYFYITFLGGNTDRLNISTCSRRRTGER